MDILYIIIIFILAYLLGSIPSAVWIGKSLHNIDVREHGSHNAGATNVIRVLGWKTGIPVLLIDLAKGWTATLLPHFFNLAEDGSTELVNLKIAAGVFAVTGHILPVFAGFRGGKGVATIFGALLAIHPFLTLSCIGIFLIVLLITGTVSVASMFAGISFPVLLFLVFDSNSVTFKIFSIIVASAILFTHRKNIGRLRRREEPKFIKYHKKKN